MSGLGGTAHVERLVLVALCIWLVVSPAAAAADSQEAWAALVNGGHVALIRHGNAPPGYGDPPGFKIDDCATQRNLDEGGRAQARALGRGLPPARCTRREDPLLALVPVPGDGTADGAGSSRRHMGRGGIRQEPGAARRVEADVGQLARTGHARGGDSRANGSSTGRYHAGPG